MKSLTRSLLLCLPGLCSWHAQAAPDLLAPIDSRFISEHFRLQAPVAVDSESADARSIPGCTQVKSFQVVEGNAPGELLVALCKDGEFGPGSVDATLARQTAEARKTLQGMPAPLADLALSGVEPLPIPLAGGSLGKAVKMPALGHGFVMIPLAHAPAPAQDATILVLAYLDPNAPRNLNQPMAALMQAIHKRLGQERD